MLYNSYIYYIIYQRIVYDRLRLSACLILLNLLSVKPCSRASSSSDNCLPFGSCLFSLHAVNTRSLTDCGYVVRDFFSVVGGGDGDAGGVPGSAAMLASLTVGERPRGEGCGTSGTGLSLRSMACSGGRSVVDNEWTDCSNTSSCLPASALYCSKPCVIA